MVERSHPRGFTLIEVIIAAGLLVAIALGSAQLFALAIRQSLSAKQQLVMSVLAARKIDELVAAVAAGPISPSPADSLDRAVDGFADVADEAGARYLRRWQVTPLAAFGGTAVAIAVRISAPTIGTADVQVITICQAPAS
jgi:type II secretory pathway pseudopilin PulG